MSANTSFTCYDSMKNFDAPYIDNNTYPKRLDDCLESLCQQAGLVLGSKNFPNNSYMIKGNPFTNGETRKTVLSNLVQLTGGFAEVDAEDGKLYVRNLDVNGEPVETIDGNNYDEFKPNDIFGPVNSIRLLMNSGVDGEETIKESDGVTDENRCQITIADNYYLTSAEERETVINDIFNALNGLTYLPVEINYYGYPWLKLGSKIKVKDKNNNEYITYVMEHTLKYNGAYSGNIKAIALTKTQVAYKEALSLKDWKRKTEFAVNKIDGQITSLIQEKDDTQERITQISQDINNVQNLFQITGGSNLIQNSTGLFGLEDIYWIAEEGGIYSPIGEDSTLIGQTISTSQLTVENGSLTTSDTNIISLSIQEIKSLTFKYKQDANTTTTIKVYGLDKDNPYYSETFTEEQTYWKEVSASFYIDTPNIFVKIESSSTLTGKFYISDLMLNHGDKKSWEPSANEIWGTIVKLSQIGLQVYSVIGNICTLITSTGFQIREFSNNRIGDIITDFTRTGIMTGDITQSGAHTQENLVSKKIIDSSNNEIYIEYIKD